MSDEERHTYNKHAERPCKAEWGCRKMKLRQLGFYKDFEKSSFSNLKLLSWKAGIVTGWNTTEAARLKTLPCLRSGG